jgi:hypothetical protein
MKSRILLIAGIVAALAVAPAFARVDFTPLGVYDAVPFDLSDDGSKVVLTGYFGFPNLYWTADEGVVDLGGGCGAGQIAISGDGSVIVGCAQDENGKGQAGLWLGGQDWKLLGSEPGGVPCDSSLSSPWDVSQDGTRAVGLLWRAQLCRAVAGYWDLATAPPAVSLGTTVPNSASRANTINADGTVIAGWQDDAFGQRSAVKWVNGVQEPILTDAGGYNGEALKMNNGATAIVGVNYNYNGSGLGWIWRADKGMISFGQGGANGQIQTIPTGVSDDGNTVVGFVRGPQATRSFLWTDNKGFQWLDDVLKGQTAAGWQLTFLDAITPDGKILVGYGINPGGQIEAFKINLKASGKP